MNLYQPVASIQQELGGMVRRRAGTNCHVPTLILTLLHYLWTGASHSQASEAGLSLAHIVYRGKLSFP